MVYDLEFTQWVVVVVEEEEVVVKVELHLKEKLFGPSEGNAHRAKRTSSEDI